LSFEHELSGRGEMHDHHRNLIDFHRQFRVSRGDRGRRRRQAWSNRSCHESCTL